MRQYLLDTLKEFKFDKKCSQELIKCFDAIKDKKIIQKVLNEYKDTNFKHREILKKFQDECLKKYKLNEYITGFLFLLVLTKKVRTFYKKANLSYQLFYETFMDIKYKVIECILVKHTVGVFCAWWFDDYFNLKRFKLGRLQYELTTFQKEYKDERICLTKDMKAIYVHIARTGEPIDPKSVNKSLELAKVFFRPYFNNGPILFKTESWLIHPVTLKFVNKESNIYKFSKLFKIIDFTTDKDQSEMWRLFDDDVSDLTKLKADTSLRKKYLAYLKKGGMPGEGIGFFIA